MRVEGLSFRYLHFYGSYETMQDNPLWSIGAHSRRRLGVGVRSAAMRAAFLVIGPNGSRRLRRATLPRASSLRLGASPADHGAKQIHLEGLVDGPSAVADANEHEVASRIYAASAPAFVSPIASRGDA